MQLVNLIPQQYIRSNGWDGEREEQFSQVGAKVYGQEREAANCSPVLVVVVRSKTLCSEAVRVVVSSISLTTLSRALCKYDIAIPLI